MIPASSPTGGKSGPVLQVGCPALNDLDPAATTARFAHSGYLALPSLLDPGALCDLRAEVDRLLAEARRRDFDMECMDGTPRHMTTLGGVEISRLAPRITEMYRSPDLVGGLGRLVGLELTLADDPVERHVLNCLHRGGDTHGLHTDDYPLALVIFLESPTCAEGCGHLEFFSVCTAGHSSVLTHDAGDAYLLRADQLPHRVRPIHDGCVRTVLNFAYGVEGETVTKTDSASILYS